MDYTRIESVRIRGFRSLADVELAGISKAAVLIGANGSGKSNFIRFFEMLSWMVRARRLAEFVERIKKIIPRYEKKVDAPLLAIKIGLAKIRDECPRFNGCVASLESLGN